MKSARHLLIGAWKSHRTRTLRTYAKYQRADSATRRRLATIFGRLRLRYTRRYIHGELRGSKWRCRYEILGEDADSIVIRISDSTLRDQIDPILLDCVEGLFAPRLQHIQFRTIRGREYYWIGLGGLCEWFKRVYCCGAQRSQQLHPLLLAP